MEGHVLTFLKKTAKVISANVKNHFMERIVKKCSKVSLYCVVYTLARYCARSNINSRYSFCSLKGCDEGWIAFKHDCYRVIPGERPWNVAKAVCEIQHGNLVAVKSEEENAFINKNFSKYNLWIGIIECLCGKKCAVDFSKVKYSKWDTCEPKDLDEAKGCALIEKGTGKWQNRDCNERHHTLCKRGENFFR